MASPSQQHGYHHQNSQLVNIRSVWAENVEEELALIRAAVPDYPIIALDTEFPRATHTSTKNYRTRSVELRYKLLQANVTDHHLTQLGITLSDASGRLPYAGFIWEFNFRPFDMKRERHNPATLAFLHRRRPHELHGMRSINNNNTSSSSKHPNPIDFALFSKMLLKSSGLVRNARTTWVVFGGAYDMGYLVKILLNGGAPLPALHQGFTRMLEYFFGAQVFDIKNLANQCGIIDDRFGLEDLAAEIGVQRVSGRAHNAGSDSLLTSYVFHAMKEILPVGWEEEHCGVICGIHVI